jgi:SAM-dependent methyltransferase
MSRISLRYFAGYSFLIPVCILTKVLEQMWRVVSIPQQFALILWTPREIDRFARSDWNSLLSVRGYARMDDWLGVTEKTLVETYFTKDGALLNVACGAGREALLLAKRGLRVTACDWSPRMITEARRRVQEANLPVRFAVADLMDDLPFPEKTFDYLLLTNITYSYLFPRRRRIRFLRQAHWVLKPGGVFIISFAPASGNPRTPAGPLEWLFMRLRQWPPFNREYEPGDRIAGTTFTHFFRSEELGQEFQEGRFLIKEWSWEKGYAVLVKL